MILLYVDDLQLFFNSRKEVEEIKKKLKEKYRMVDLGPARRFLGMNINTMESSFALYQTSYIESLLRRFRMTDTYGADTPIDIHVSLDITTDNTDNPIDQTEYLALVGSLMYAAIGTRPDISYAQAVGLLSSYNANPRTRHLTAAKRVLRYLKKQTLVAQSTKEAEYTAFNEASREALWLRQLLSDINNRGSQPQADPEPPVANTTIVHADNQGAIRHRNTEGITARTKHFDIYLKHVRDLQQKVIVRFTYIQSAENTADTLMKGLPAPSHRRHVENLGLDM